MKETITKEDLLSGFNGVCKNTPENVALMEELHNKEIADDLFVGKEVYPASNPFGYWKPCVGTVTIYSNLRSPYSEIRIYSPEAEELYIKKRQRQIMAAAIEAVVADFARSGVRDNAALAATILAAAPEADSVYFATGGDDSEPEGAVVSTKEGTFEVGGVRNLVDWTSAKPVAYQRYREYEGYRQTETFTR